MKVFAIIALIIFSTTSYARQYIQCSEDSTTNRIVINLNDEQSTLFLTNGVHLPDSQRALKNLYYLSTQDHYVLYETDEGNSKETVFIPKDKIGVISNSFKVKLQSELVLKTTVYEVELSCFSNIF